jgi:hypothetical protein
MFILACSSRKNKGKHEARNLYIGNSLNSPIKYANYFFGNKWYILSAEYGIIKSNIIIQDYDTSFSHPESNPITSQKISILFPDPKTNVEFIGGKNYIKILQKAWPESNIKNFFFDYGISYQGMWRRALKEAYNNKTDIHNWLSIHKDKYIPKKLSDKEVKDWIFNNYQLHRSMIKLAHIFRDNGYSCDEHRWERLYKEVPIPKKS